ncbi:MAG: hypothetical protein AB7G36_18830 [Candidatus Nanopelagicales bacterium]
MGVVLGFVAGGIAVDATTAEPAPVVEVREDVFRVNALQAEVSRLEQELEDTRGELWTASADRDRFEATLRTVTAQRDEARADAIELNRGLGQAEAAIGVLVSELDRYKAGSIATACGLAAGANLSSFADLLLGGQLTRQCLDRISGTATNFFTETFGTP